MGIFSGGGPSGNINFTGHIGFSPGWAGLFTLSGLLLIALLCWCSWCCGVLIGIKRRFFKNKSPSLVHLENGSYWTTLPNFYVDNTITHNNLDGLRHNNIEDNNNLNAYYSSGSSHYDKIGEATKNTVLKDDNNDNDITQENIYCEIDSNYYEKN